MPGLQQVTHDQQGNAFWAGNNLYAGASASQATGAAAVTLVNLLAGAQSGDSPALVGAQALTVIVYNNGTAQTITGLSLATTGTTASGGKGSITYPISKDVNGNAVNIASGSSQTFFVPITNGILEELVLTPTFGAAPAAGTVETMTTVHTSPTAAMQMLGSNATEGVYTFAIPASGTAAVTANVPIPTPTQADALYLVSVLNPSTIAQACTIQFNNAINFGSGIEYCEVTSVSVATGGLNSYLVQGWLMGDGAAQISVTPAAAATAAGNVLVQVRKV